MDALGPVGGALPVSDCTSSTGGGCRLGCEPDAGTDGATSGGVLSVLSPAVDVMAVGEVNGTSLDTRSVSSWGRDEGTVSGPGTMTGGGGEVRRAGSGAEVDAEAGAGAKGAGAEAIGTAGFDGPESLSRSRIKSGRSFRGSLGGNRSVSGGYLSILSRSSRSSLPRTHAPPRSCERLLWLNRSLSS